MPTATIRLSEEESRLIRSFATQERRSVSDVIRLAILDRIEDEYDLEAARRAWAEYELSPISYGLAEIKERHGLS